VGEGGREGDGWKVGLGTGVREGDGMEVFVAAGWVETLRAGGGGLAGWPQAESSGISTTMRRRDLRTNIVIPILRSQLIRIW
jgi:hypothetical protein